MIKRLLNILKDKYLYKNIEFDVNETMSDLIIATEAALPVSQKSVPPTYKTEQFPYKIGYTCNLLNNHYNFARIARKMKAEAFLAMDPFYQDTLPTSFPFWDEIEGEISSFQSASEINSIATQFKSEDWLRTVVWSDKNDAKLREMSKEKLKDWLEQDFSFRFDNFSFYDHLSFIPASGHLELLKFMNEMDVIQTQGIHIGIAAYSQTPYLTRCYGSDIYDLPFMNNRKIRNFQIRGFKKASKHLTDASAVVDALVSLGIPENKISIVPFPVDTDFYSRIPPENNEIAKKYKNKKMIFLVARQNWTWKGNEAIFTAIKNLSLRRQDFICPVVWYGQDIDKSDQLIKELGIAPFIEKIKILTRKKLIKYYSAANIVIDQLNMGIFGTSALEAMSCQCPVICNYTSKMLHSSPAPVVSASNSAELLDRINYILDTPSATRAIGEASREWIEKNCGYQTLWPQYDEIYRKTITDSNVVG